MTGSSNSSSNIDEESGSNIGGGSNDSKEGLLGDKGFFNEDDNNIGTTAFNNNNNRTSTGRIKEIREGHSKKQQRVLAQYRKDMVFSLSSQGYNQPQISSMLRIHQSTVSLILQQLRRDAAASMKQFLSEKLPLIYQECYESISQVINRSWQLVNDKNTPIQAKVALLSLITDATEAKMDLSSGGEVIQQGIEYAQNMKNKYVEIIKTNDILHDAEEVEEDSSLNDANNNNNNGNGKKRNTKNTVF